LSVSSNRQEEQQWCDPCPWSPLFLKSLSVKRLGTSMHPVHTEDVRAGVNGGCQSAGPRHSQSRRQRWLSECWSQTFSSVGCIVTTELCFWSLVEKKKGCLRGYVLRAQDTLIMVQVVQNLVRKAFSVSSPSVCSSVFSRPSPPSRVTTTSRSGAGVPD
jgi:hypothetical protein